MTPYYIKILHKHSSYKQYKAEQRNPGLLGYSQVKHNIILAKVVCTKIKLRITANRKLSKNHQKIIYFNLKTSELSMIPSLQKYQITTPKISISRITHKKYVTMNKQKRMS